VRRKKAGQGARNEQGQAGGGDSQGGEGEVGHLGPIGTQPDELHYLLGIPDRQGPQQHDIRQTEKGRIRANGQRQRDYGDCAEDWGLDKHADGIAHVSPEGLKGGEGSQLPTGFANVRTVSEQASRRHLGLVIASVFLGPHGEVKTELIIQITLQSAAMNERLES